MTIPFLCYTISICAYAKLSNKNIHLPSVIISHDESAIQFGIKLHHSFYRIISYKIFFFLDFWVYFLKQTEKKIKWIIQHYFCLFHWYVNVIIMYELTVWAQGKEKQKSYIICNLQQTFRINWFDSTLNKYTFEFWRRTNEFFLKLPRSKW